MTLAGLFWKKDVPVVHCRYTCRGLFERHKLLFSFHMCAKILEAASKLNMDEYNFFLRGGVVRTVQNYSYLFPLGREKTF